MPTFGNIRSLHRRSARRLRLGPGDARSRAGAPCGDEAPGGPAALSGEEGADLLDTLTTLPDSVARDVRPAQVAGCVPEIAADAALHAHRWFLEQVDRTLRLIRAAGGPEIGRDDLNLLAPLLEAATRRLPARR